MNSGALDGLQVGVEDAGECYRRAALVLHGLAAGDSDWLLERLPEPQSESLRPLLRELADLGIPSDPSLVRSVLLESAPAAASRADYAMLDAVGAACMDEYLAREPDRFVASVLAVRPWSWSEDLLARMGPARAERLRALGLQWHPPVALQQAVLEVLVAKVGEAVAEKPEAPLRPAHPGGAWWRRWGRRAGA